MELKVKDITKNFGDNEVLKGISFSARAGDFCGSRNPTICPIEFLRYVVVPPCTWRGQR